MGKQTVCMACLLSKGFIIFYGVFGKVDFWEDGKKKKKMRRKNFLECLVGREREENDGGIHMFSCT